METAYRPPAEVDTTLLEAIKTDGGSFFAENPDNVVRMSGRMRGKQRIIDTLKSKMTMPLDGTLDGALTRIGM